MKYNSLNTYITCSCISLGVILFILIPSICSAETPEEVAARVQDRYDRLLSLNFDFMQNTKGTMSGRPKTGMGRAFFLKNTRPGKMRWNYSSPETQVLVSDGKTFSMYFASLQQMIVTPVDRMKQDLTYSFFTGNGNLLQDFDITDAAREMSAPEPSTSVIKLTPRAKQTQVAFIELWVTEDSMIRRIEIVDQFDTITILNLTNVQIDTLETNDREQMEALFSFIPPEGTEIIKQ